MNDKTLNPTGTELYTMEKAIKLYRKYCQQSIDSYVDNVTVDQCLVLICLRERPELNQMQLADLVFKNKASVTRILNLLVEKQYVSKVLNAEDGRKNKLEISQAGRKLLTRLEPIFSQNRAQALKNFTALEIIELERLLMKIVTNCSGS
ncbi:MAG: MarR family winged helix-turn-helix transcriptional regulator [Cognaticolwellia sp.]